VKNKGGSEYEDGKMMTVAAMQLFII